MENEDKNRKKQRTSGNCIDGDDEMYASVERNPGILLALDAVHRSLLSNNSKYEAKQGDASASTSDDDDSEYFSSKSSIESNESGSDAISLNDCHFQNKIRNVDKMPTTNEVQRRHEYVHAVVHNSGQTSECNETTKYSADELHTNRSRYFNCHTKNEPKNHRRISAQHYVDSSRQRTNDFSAMNEEMRCCARPSEQRMVESSTKGNRKMKSEHAQQPKQQQLQQRRALCKCVKAVNNSDDTDDVTSSENRDSDTNLLIENQRNRECEMFQKICFNNGYYGSTGTSSIYTSDSNSVVSNDTNKLNGKCSDCANTIESRRQRLSSIGQQQVASVVSKSKKQSKQTHRKNSSGGERQSNVSEQSRRITITIKTKTVNDAATATIATDRVTDQNVHFFNDYETDDSNATTESECTTVNGATKAIADIAFNPSENCENEASNVKSDEENCDHDDDDDDVEQSKSESSVFLSIQSEQSQYFDCVNESASLIGKARESNNSESNTKMRSREHTKSEATNEKEDSPMIFITQEMARDRTITSQVQVNRAKIRAFKKRQKELKRPKIIDDSFCEEILKETLNLPSFVDAKRVTTGKAVTVCSDQVHAAPAPPTKSNNFISDRFSMGNLDASPKCTGKSIGRLLAHRLEQQTMTRVRRTMLQQTGIELAIADEKYVTRRKKLEELPPIKPPRSFAASSSSSPLSKESVESSTTIPIGELKRVEPSYVGWMPSASSTEPRRTKPSTHIGWVRTDQNAKNDSHPTQQNSLRFYTAEGESGLVAKEEDIDTVDFTSYVSAAHEFETFSANLDDNGGRMNLSTPIKSKSPERSADQFTTANAFDGSVCAIAAAEAVAVEKRCTKCHGMKKKSTKILSTKNGRKIGKAALKRTKTLIDSSKQFLMKSKKEKIAKRCIHEGHTCCNTVAVETPVKDPDNTARFNSETFYSCETEKRTDKSLNLTTPQERQLPRPSAPPVAELNPSPDRNVRRMDANLLRTIPQTPSSSPYVTPNASFNFDRVVEPPKPVPVVKSTGKSSPAKLISKLNQIAKNSKTLFRQKEPVQAMTSAMAEAPHYYRSFGGNQIDASVPLMGETLRSLRDKLEMDQRPVPAARKSLFTQEALDRSLNSDRIAEIELHDEPEPIYAKIEIQSSEKTPRNEDNGRSDDVDRRPKSAVRVDEVFVTTRDGMPPSKYLMVNNDPKTLYATVNRNGPATTTTTTTIETKSTDSVARVGTCSSYESLDMSSIGEFAQSLQQIMDENQLRMHRIYRTTSESGDDDAAVDDLSSGCSSFYRKSREIAETETKSKRWQDFMESLSLGTVRTGSYCESMGRGNDVNGEIKKSIGFVEETANVSGQSSQSDDLSYHCGEDELMQTARMDESDRIKSFNRTTDYQTPSSGCTSSTNGSPKNSKNNSPNFKLIKNKVRDSFRRSKNYLRSESKRWSGRLLDTNRSATDTSHDASFSLAQPCSSICNYPKSHDEKSYKTIHAKLLELPKSGGRTSMEKKLLRLDDRISHHQNIRHELSDALEMCRSTKEFQNSPELIESERLILVSNLKELAAKEELTRLWHIDSDDIVTTTANGRSALSIVYAEFPLKDDAIYDTHFNYFYVCVLSHRDTIECSSVKERNGNRVIFNDLQVQFTDLASSFEVRVEIFILRLRKNQRHSSNAFTSKNNETLAVGNAAASRFRFHGRTTLTSRDLSQNKRKQFSAQRNLRKNQQNNSMVFTMYDIVKMDMQLHGVMNNLNGDTLIGFQNEIAFDGIEHCGFVDIAQKKWKWDRLWCRIDGFRINFWAYPQDATNSIPILTLDLQQCTSSGGILTVCRDLCAKARSFKLDFRSTGAADTGAEVITSFFIAAETQSDLDSWLKAINRILDLMNVWSI